VVGLSIASCGRCSRRHLCFRFIGFYDDYLKLVVRNPKGLVPRWKYLWQSVAGLATAATLLLTATEPAETTLFSAVFKDLSRAALGLRFIVLSYLMIVGMSKCGGNLTDGLDGWRSLPAALVTAAGWGSSPTPAATRCSRSTWQIPEIRGAGELLIFCASLAAQASGSCGFNPIPPRCSWATWGRCDRRRHRRAGGDRAPGGGGAGDGAGCSCSRPLVNPAGRSFKPHRAAHFQNGAAPPPLRTQGLAEPKVIVRFWIDLAAAVLAGLADR